MRQRLVARLMLSASAVTTFVVVAGAGHKFH
jgi:hypothetical protein